MTTTLQELDEVLEAIKQAKATKDALFRFDLEALNRQRAHQFIRTHAPEIRAALELQAKLKGWRVMPMTGFKRSPDEQFEIYDPSGNGGVVLASDISDMTALRLIAALAAPPAQGEQP